MIFNIINYDIPLFDTQALKIDNDNNIEVSIYIIRYNHYVVNK